SGFEDVDHPINFNVGQISGGDWPSSVPSWCEIACVPRSIQGSSRHRPGKRSRNICGTRASLGAVRTVACHVWSEPVSSPQDIDSKKAEKPKRCSARPTGM